MSTEPKSWVTNVTDADFEGAVFARSRECPVVVDFWAEWCGPCRMLGPVLERLAQEYAGRFVLAKANTEQTPQAASQFQVQSIPAVFAVLDGEVVDYFLGALPEPQIRSWLDRLLTSHDIVAARAKESSSPSEAETMYRELAARLPHDARPRIGLARVLLQQDQVAEAQAIIDELHRRGFLEPEAEKIRAELELRSFQGGNLEQLRAEAAAQPRDLESQLRLGEALAAARHYEQALEVLLGIVEQDRKGVGDKARLCMLDIFRVLPDGSPLTSSFRRKLSQALY